MEKKRCEWQVSQCAVAIIEWWATFRTTSNSGFSSFTQKLLFKWCPQLMGKSCSHPGAWEKAEYDEKAEEESPPQELITAGGVQLPLLLPGKPSLSKLHCWEAQGMWRKKEFYRYMLTGLILNVNSMRSWKWSKGQKNLFIVMKRLSKLHLLSETTKKTHNTNTSTRT